MQLVRNFIHSLCLLLVFFCSTLTHAVEVPVLTHYVTDQTGTLTEAQISIIEQKLIQLEKRKGAQLVVLIVSTTTPQDIESYSLAVAETNKIGRKGTDDGVLLLVAKDDRRDRIEVGYGLEGTIPDATAARIQRDHIESQFKAGDFFGGIDAGVNALTQLIDAETLPQPSPTSSGNSAFGTVLICIIGIFFPALVLRSIVGILTGRSKRLMLRISVGASVMSGFGLFVDGSLSYALVGAAMGALFLVLPYAERGIEEESYSSRNHFSNSSGSNSSGGSSNSGGSGFSGGGGKFGGGGSSGSW
ncbi:TPM domain-containing protein [Vibrio fluvialis]|jgi:uncharacterized protein|uniref:TPM domain-containing protein n=1 Tax=Vibrio fluvialis TaxID=676 RepID=UPI00192C3280|nr:TPM domain-containing protein [Vibrio fluvialis]EKO3930856.1 TPM domain-containing protein [Vibrio fluvialis]MBL4279323.1 TPM domain-containing protein [Vibrio fluvialis]MBY8163084.1 TPM domain-containing protein [Vibrio fluvialis]